MDLVFHLGYPLVKALVWQGRTVCL